MPLKPRVTALLVALPMVFAAGGQALAEKYAPIMPQASRSLLLDLASTNERLLAAGEHGHILFSDDEGKTWTQARVPTTQMLTGIHFADAQHGWAVGHDGLILASDDGGETWRIQRDGLSAQHQANLEMREAAISEIKVLEAELQNPEIDEESLPELEMALEDAQMDLEDAEFVLNEPVFTSPYMDIWFQDANRGWAVGAFGAFVSTSDGGQHWKSETAHIGNPDEFHLNAITGDGQGRVFVAGEGGVMFRSLDGGLSWETLEPFYEGSWFGAVYDAKFDALLIFGLRGNLYRSTDFGTTWDPVATDNTITLAGGTSDGKGRIVLGGGVGTVLHSDDGGQTFSRTMVEDRLSLSSGMNRKGQLVLIGQGGTKVRKAED